VNLTQKTNIKRETLQTLQKIAESDIWIFLANEHMSWNWQKWISRVIVHGFFPIPGFIQNRQEGTKTCFIILVIITEIPSKWLSILLRNIYKMQL